ncbi:helix-turn-helix transcriptional regulator (plasmid) [Paraburkholderia strydomiana]
MIDATIRLVRRREASAITGLPEATLYYHIREGLMVKPVKIGRRSSAWPVSELDAIMAAQIAGKSLDEIRELVKLLETARGKAK